MNKKPLSPGEEFFWNHLKMFNDGRLKEMVEHDYTDDAELISFYEGLGVPYPFNVIGKEGLLDLFQKYSMIVGKIEIVDIKFINDFKGSDGYISLLSTFRCKIGLVKGGDSWLMQDGKIRYHIIYAALTKEEKLP